MNAPGQRVKHPINQQVSSNLRAMRMQAGLSQTHLARHLGVSFQQVQKYEAGANRPNPAVIVEWTRGCGQEIIAAFAGIDNPTTHPDYLIALRATQNLMRLANAMPVEMRRSLVVIARNMLGAIAPAQERKGE